MKGIPITLFFLFLVIVSCNTERGKQINDADTQKDLTAVNKELEGNPTEEMLAVKTKTSIKNDNSSQYDAIPSFTVDDYPVTNAMFKIAKYPEEPVLSFDGLWFSSGNQTLAIALYTDYYRYAIFHFRNDFVPTDLIDKMGLHKPPPDNDIADLNLKIELFKSVFPKLNEVDSSYLISNKGFRLGDLKMKAINEYGQADLVKYDGIVEIVSWEFIGDTFYDGKQELNGKPLAKNSFGHQLKMYFKNEKLIGMFLHNDIP